MEDSVKNVLSKLECEYCKECGCNRIHTFRVIAEDSEGLIDFSGFRCGQCLHFFPISDTDKEDFERFSAQGECTCIEKEVNENE